MEEGVAEELPGACSDWKKPLDEPKKARFTRRSSEQEGKVITFQNLRPPFRCSSMDALVCRELGDPTLPISDSSPLRLSNDHPIPELSSTTSVRVRVRATSLNYANYLQILGKYQEKPPLPFIPGSDYSGIVESVGSGVRKFKVGDRVCSFAPLGSFAAFIVAEERDL